MSLLAEVALEWVELRDDQRLSSALSEGIVEFNA